VGHTAGLDAVQKRKFLSLPGLELRPLGRPTRSQSLYRPPYLDTSSAALIFLKTPHLDEFRKVNSIFSFNAVCCLDCGLRSEASMLYIKELNVNKKVRNRKKECEFAKN
jgi:hypothetical protein